MHLGSNHKLSTFRRSLGSILANAAGQANIDEDRLTCWMYRHLRVITVAVADADTLDEVETAVLNALNPSLNLAKMPRTATRSAFTEIRRDGP
jgi:hypothetical protein